MKRRVRRREQPRLHTIRSSSRIWHRLRWPRREHTFTKEATCGSVAVTVGYVSSRDVRILAVVHEDGSACDFCAAVCGSPVTQTESEGSARRCGGRFDWHGQPLRCDLPSRHAGWHTAKPEQGALVRWNDEGSYESHEPTVTFRARAGADVPGPAPAVEMPGVTVSVHGPGANIESAIKAGEATKGLLEAVTEEMGLGGQVEWEVASVQFRCDGCGTTRPDRPGPDEGWTYSDGVGDLCPACTAGEAADEQRRDVCPDCGAERVELVVVPGRFYCTKCAVAGEGPNVAVPTAGAQLGLDLGAVS